LATGGVVRRGTPRDDGRHEAARALLAQVRQAALVADPPIVHFGVHARDDALDPVVDLARGGHHRLLLPHADDDVAAARAPRADRGRVAEVPDPRLEAELLERERAHRTEIHDVPRVRVVEALAGEDPDLAALAALEEPELAGLRDLVAEADAAAALDAALLVERDVRPDVHRLRERQLRLSVAADTGPVLHRVLLEPALPRLVADRTVERVVDEEELHHRRPRLLDLLVLGVDHHAVGDRRVAADDELRLLLDVHEAHAAVPAIDRPSW
jgi:hypothetical protein